MNMNHSNGLLDILAAAAAAASAPELENDLIGQDRARGNFRHVQSNIPANSKSDSKIDPRVQVNWGDRKAVSNTESTPNEVIKRRNDDGKFRQLHPHLYSKHSDSQRKRKKSSPISNSAKIPKHIHVNAEEQHNHQKYIRFSSGLTNSDSESSLAVKKFSPDKSGKEQYNQQQTPDSRINIKRGYEENNCNYVDRSQEVDTLPATHLTTLNRSPSFIVKLYAMLSHPELSHIITWLPHGRSWTIIDPIELEVAVIPKYMGNGMSLISFMKRTATWGFERTAIDGDGMTGNGHNRLRRHQHRKSYWHEYFLRGKPHLLKKMAPLEKVASPINCPKKKRNTGKQNHGAASNNNNNVPSSPQNDVSEGDLSRTSERFPLSTSIPNLEEADDSAMGMKLIDQFIIEHGPTARVPASLFRRTKTSSNGSNSNTATKSSGPEDKLKLAASEASFAKRAKVSHSSDNTSVLAVNSFFAESNKCTNNVLEKQATLNIENFSSKNASSSSSACVNSNGGSNTPTPNATTINNINNYFPFASNNGNTRSQQQGNTMIPASMKEHTSQHQNPPPFNFSSGNQSRHQRVQPANTMNLQEVNGITSQPAAPYSSNTSNGVMPSLASLSTRNASGYNDFRQTLPVSVQSTNQCQFEDLIRNIIQLSFVAGIILGANNVSNANRNNLSNSMSSSASCATSSATSSGDSDASR